MCVRAGSLHTSKPVNELSVQDSSIFIKVAKYLMHKVAALSSVFMGQLQACWCVICTKMQKYSTTFFGRDIHFVHGVRGDVRSNFVSQVVVSEIHPFNEEHLSLSRPDGVQVGIKKRVGRFGGQARLEKKS